MNDYIATHGLVCDMVALDSMEIARASGIQQGGAAPARCVLMASSCYLDRAGYQQAAKELEALRTVLEQEQKAVDKVQDYATELKQVVDIDHALNPEVAVHSWIWSQEQLTKNWQNFLMR